MARKKELDDEKVLADIYSRAVDILENEGIEKISVRKVCNTVGISTGTFYSYYPTKARLIVRLLDGMKNYYEKDVFPYLTGDSLQQLGQILQAYGKRVTSRGVNYARTFYVYYAVNNNLFLSYNPDGRYFKKMLTDRVQKCIDDGFFGKSTDAEKIAEQLHLICFGLLIDYTYYESSEKAMETAKEVYDNYISGLRDKTSAVGIKPRHTADFPFGEIISK